MQMDPSPASGNKAGTASQGAATSLHAMCSQAAVTSLHAVCSHGTDPGTVDRTGTAHHVTLHCPVPTDTHNTSGVSPCNAPPRSIARGGGTGRINLAVCTHASTQKQCLLQALHRHIKQPKQPSHARPSARVGTPSLVQARMVSKPRPASVSTPDNPLWPSQALTTPTGTCCHCHDPSALMPAGPKRERQLPALSRLATRTQAHRWRYVLGRTSGNMTPFQDWATVVRGGLLPERCAGNQPCPAHARAAKHCVCAAASKKHKDAAATHRQHPWQEARGWKRCTDILTYVTVWNPSHSSRLGNLQCTQPCLVPPPAAPDAQLQRTLQAAPRGMWPPCGTGCLLCWGGDHGMQ
jgi:hypothetical protein